MDISKLSYEEAINELETILESLEKDESTLEESMNSFKKGMEIHRYCRDILEKTEGEIKVLLEKDDNIYEETFYSEEED